MCVQKRTSSCSIDEPFSLKNESNCTAKDFKTVPVASLSFKFNGHSIVLYLNSKLTSILNFFLLLVVFQLFYFTKNDFLLECNFTMINNNNINSKYFYLNK